MRRFIIPLLFGLIGAAVLISLGVWQIQRLTWKESILTEIEGRVTAPPVALPDTPDVETDKYRAVVVTGDVLAPYLRVLDSRKRIGPGYRLINVMQVGERRILLDRGFVTQDEQPTEGRYADATVTGNLVWPDDKNSSTPEPDLEQNLWFARDVDAMAAVLDAEPTLIVARETSFYDTPVTPLPVDRISIPNDHLEYAITWFSLAAIWLVMTGYFIRRMRHKPEGTET
ncbi:SURF1 family protein [Roseovarius sp. EL26]|uniref:SURF1 family protein n=1 Tax=Roseovarius sp. EL26 TaxID=2126672 RepID=UPI000EA3110F|nr:SURF1 family protein [Roseovarius sp. EL26]